MYTDEESLEYFLQLRSEALAGSLYKLPLMKLTEAPYELSDAEIMTLTEDWSSERKSWIAPVSDFAGPGRFGNWELTRPTRAYPPGEGWQGFNSLWRKLLAIARETSLLTRRSVIRVSKFEEIFLSYQADRPEDDDLRDLHPKEAFWRLVFCGTIVFKGEGRTIEYSLRKELRDPPTSDLHDQEDS